MEDGKRKVFFLILFVLGVILTILTVLGSMALRLWFKLQFDPEFMFLLTLSGVITMLIGTGGLFKTGFFD